MPDNICSKFAQFTVEYPGTSKEPDKFKIQFLGQASSRHCNLWRESTDDFKNTHWNVVGDFEKPQVLLAYLANTLTLENK